jgi:thioredoxin 1
MKLTGVTLAVFILLTGIRFGANAQIGFSKTSWNAALKKAQAEHKLIFVDAYANWCGPCKELKATTFKDKKVVAFFNAHFVNLSIDTEKGEGVTLANEWGVDSYPTLILFNSQGKKIAVNEGFVDAAALLQFAKEAQAKVGAVTR